jgi:hypothetical protein
MPVILAVHEFVNGTSRHFVAMRNLVAIGASRTWRKLHHSISIYEYAP